jgi:hypothetical protein
MVDNFLGLIEILAASFEFAEQLDWRSTDEASLNKVHYFVNAEKLPYNILFSSSTN